MTQFVFHCYIVINKNSKEFRKKNGHAHKHTQFSYFIQRLDMVSFILKVHIAITRERKIHITNNICQIEGAERLGSNINLFLLRPSITEQ